jgi:signal transduction histidine kinase
MNMKRFFEFLFPERTHLKAVIAALVAIFLLSGVLAYQVHVSEKTRAEQQEKQLQDYAAGAGNTLRARLSELGTNQIAAAFRAATRLADGGASLDIISSGVSFNTLCGCAAAGNDSTVHSFALQGDNTSVLPATLRREITRAPARDMIRGRWFVGAFMSKALGEPRTIVFLRNTERAWALTLPAAYAMHILTGTVSAPFEGNGIALVLPELVEPLRQPEVMRVDVAIPLLPEVHSSGQTIVSRKSTVISNHNILPGTTITTGFLQAGRDKMILKQPFWLTPNLLYILMAMIAGVITMAIALVRREEELHRLRSDLISGVSHELRTPLAQIRMFAETLLLGRTRTEAERRRSLEVIDQEAKRLSHFVENMLQFAKGEGGRTRLVPEHTSFAVEIRRAVESFAPMCQARGVEVRTELEDGVTAPVDRAALRRIMLNLMENALKYGPDEQRITVGIALFNDVVRVWVDDEGEGIPRLDRERVFDSFYRLNRELDRRVTGSGIGLAVVRQLATLHGGRAWAEDAPGGGARLVVEFPDAYVRPAEEGSGWAVA